MSRLHKDEIERIRARWLDTASDMTASLHEWDGDVDAGLDRARGLYGRQLSNREPVDDARRVTVINPQPERVYAHLVVWRDGKPHLWSDPRWLDPGDSVSTDLHRDVTIS